MSVNFQSFYPKSNGRSMYEYIQEKLTRNTLKTGLIGGIFCYLSGRYVYSKLYRWYYSLPPGPIGVIPKIGNTLSTLFKTKWNITWTLYYGQVFSLYEWNKYTIMINDASIAKQILSKSTAQNRSMAGTLEDDRKNFNMLAADDNTPSFIALNGKKWTKMRQLMHTNLVRVMSTKYVNNIINESIKSELEPELKKILKSGNDDGENIWFCREILSHLTFNIIFQANFGRNVGFKNNKLCKELAADLVDVVGWDIAKRTVLLLLFPRLAPTVLPSSYFRPCYNIKKRINNNIKQLIEERNNENNNGSNNKNKEEMTFIDHTRELTESDDEYTRSQEIADIKLMFLAGTDTTSISTEWGLLLLSKQPDIQNMVRNELFYVLDRNNIDYKSNNSVNIVFDIKLLLQLPLFRALIHEILRISCVARTGVPHTATTDIWITTKNGKKYFIPKHSKLSYNVEAIHYNVLGNENWKNKQYNKHFQQICLENWLNKENGKFVQNPSFITFGHGKRDCVGKQLAMKEMRVMLGYLLLNYRFSVKPEHMKMKYIPCKGGVRGGVAKPLPQIPLIIEQIRSD